MEPSLNLVDVGLPKPTRMLVILMLYQVAVRFNPVRKLLVGA